MDAYAGRKSTKFIELAKMFEKDGLIFLLEKMSQKSGK